jgi:hypothetical protein
MAFTLTVTVQLPPAAMLPFCKAIPNPPAVSGPVLVELRTVAPAQVVDATSGVATTIWPGDTGNMSVNDGLAKVAAMVELVVLLSVKVNVAVSPEPIVARLNALLMVGGTRTVRFCTAQPVPADGVCVLIIPVQVFGFTPPVLLVIGTITVQLPAAGMVNPLKVSKPVCPAENRLVPAPAHVPVAAPGVAMLILDKVSVKLAPVSAAALVLLRVKVRLVVAPVEMVGVAKALLIVGEVTTVRVAVVASGLELPSKVVTAPTGIVLT